MKVLDNSKLQAKEDVPVVSAIPASSRKPEPVRADVIPVRPAFSNAENAVIFFLRQFRVLLGAARLYQRNHPRLMEILASTEQQLRIALAARSPLVVAVERNGILLPRQEGSVAELLHDPRGELRALAEELLRAGICSFLFTHPINVGELDLLAQEISLVPRSASPGDTASRKLWDNWIRNRGVVGIRINIPTERRDSLLLASLVSAVLAYDNASQHSSYSRAGRTMPEASFEQIAATLRVLAKLAPPNDPEMQPSTEEVARRFHSVVSGSEPSSVSLIVYGVSNVKPREGETLEPYLERLTDELVLAFVKQEFNAGRDNSAGAGPLARAPGPGTRPAGQYGNQPVWRVAARRTARVDSLRKILERAARPGERENIAEPRRVVRARERGGPLPRTAGRGRRKKEIRRRGARGPRRAAGVCAVPRIGREQGAARRGRGPLGNRAATGTIVASFLGARFWARDCAGPPAGNFAGNRGIALRGGREIGANFVVEARIRRIRANPRSARGRAAGR